MRAAAEFEFLLAPRHAPQSAEELANLPAHLRAVEEQAPR